MTHDTSDYGARGALARNLPAGRSSPRLISRATFLSRVLGGAALQKLRGTSLDSTAQLDALCRVPVEQRGALIERAASGENINIIAMQGAYLRIKRAVRRALRALNDCALTPDSSAIMHIVMETDLAIDPRAVSLARALTDGLERRMSVNVCEARSSGGAA